MLLNKIYNYQTLEYFQNIRNGSVQDLIIYELPYLNDLGVGMISKYKGQLLDLSFPGRQVEIKYPVMPIYHPSYLMRNPSMEEGGDWDITEQHVANAVNLVEEYIKTNG